MRDMKKFTSKELIKTIFEINESIREWLLKKFEFVAKRIKQRLNYIHNNPVEEGYVYESEYYIYSSANEYAGGMSNTIALQMLL